MVIIMYNREVKIKTSELNINMVTYKTNYSTPSLTNQTLDELNIWIISSLTTDMLTSRGTGFHLSIVLLGAWISRCVLKKMCLY